MPTPTQTTRITVCRPAPGLVRWALGVEYLGTAGHGWQIQADGGGIADRLADALSGIASPIGRLVGSGRTDTGVHALWQLLHFDVPEENNRPARAWILGGNRLLPPEIRIRWARRVPADFHARFSALRRNYAYLIHNAAVLPAFRHGRAALECNPLDVAAMHEAAQVLCGSHDFSAFRSADCSSRSTVRSLHRIAVRRFDDIVSFELCADAFLRRMVRIIVGSLWQVGLGRRPPEYMAQILHSGDRDRAGDTAVAQGLYFLGADYPPEFGIPAAPGVSSLLAAY